MKDINLIPDWYRADRRRKRDLILRATCLGTLAAAMLLASAGRYAQTAVAQGDLEKLQAGFECQADVIRALAELKLRLDELHDKQHLLSDVAGGAPLHTVLSELSQLMPQAMVLTRFHITQERRITGAESVREGQEEGAETFPATDQLDGKIEITGWASSDVNVGSLLTNMAGSEVFCEPRLRYSKPGVVNEREAREFKLAARLPQFE